MKIENISCATVHRLQAETLDYLNTHHHATLHITIMTQHNAAVTAPFPADVCALHWETVKKGKCKCTGKFDSGVTFLIYLSVGIDHLPL